MQRLKTIIPLSLVLMAFWILLLSELKPWNLLVGVIVSVLLAYLANLLIPSDIYSRFSIGFIFRVPVFFVLLIWEIIKSNVSVFKLVMSPSLPINPQSTNFETFLESHTAITVLAGAINLNPGTTILDIDGRRFFIHGLGDSHAKQILEKRLERMVAWLFREGPREHWRLR